MADLLRCEGIKMSNKFLNPLKPSHEQLDIAIPKLLDAKSVLDEVLPFTLPLQQKHPKTQKLFTH